MKVLMFGWEFPPHISGGLGTACYGLTQSLVNEGTQILFVVPRAYGDEEMSLINASDILLSESEKTELLKFSIKDLISKDIRVIPVPSAIKPYSFSYGKDANTIEQWNYEIQSKDQYPQASVKVKQYKFSGTYGLGLLEEVARYGEVASVIARQHSFNVIHAHDWLTYPAGIAAKEVSAKPLIVHVHSTEFDRTDEENIDPRVYAIECEGFKKADHIVAVSHSTKRVLLSKYRIPESKVSVVHNGIMTKERAQFVKLPRVSKHIVTFLGRITYQKGPQYFIAAARKVLQRFPNAHFVMAGSGDLLPAMIERVAQFRLSSRFHFTGFLQRQQVDQIWSVSDLYVMPSVSEPFGISSLEALQAGVPVIISKQSGVSEVLPHAIKLNFWDVDGLANAICNVLSHKSLSGTMIKNGKKTLKRISWNMAAKKINNLYHETIRQN